MKRSLALLTILAVLAAGCTVPATPGPGPTPGPTPQPSGISTGTIEIRVTDAPPRDEVTSIMVTVASVEIHKAGTEQEPEEQPPDDGDQDQEEGTGEWITIPITGNNPFDLLLLQKENLDELLATEEVTAGKYTQIRMTIDKVEVTLGDGELQEATLPSGKLKFVRPFNVTDGENTILLLDFDADKSVTVTGNGKIIVKPVVKLTVKQDKPQQLTSVEGTISEVDTEDSTVSIIPTGETEPVILNVTPDTEITLDGETATIGDLDGLGEGNTVTASYYADSFEAVEINAQSPPE